MKNFLVVLLASWLSAVPCFAINLFSPETDALNIPKRDDLKIDGDFLDWDAGTYTTIRLFADEAGRRESLAANLRLAWTNNQLLIALSVADDVIAEAPGFSLWQGDGLVLHISNGVGDQPILFMLTPGIGAVGEVVESRTLINDHRSDPALKSIEFHPKYATRANESGYQMEIGLPLASVGLAKPRLGDLVGLQIEVKDREDDTEKPDLQWNPELNATRNPKALTTIRLANQADFRSQFSAMGRVVDEKIAQVLLYADSPAVGLPVTVRFPGGDPIAATLSVKPGEAFASAIVEVPFTGDYGEPWVAEVNSEEQLLARRDFASVLWVDSERDFAPVPSFSAMMAFEKDRLEHNYPKNSILAIGSSSIRFWDTIADDLAPWPIIKRGFGGSAMSDVYGAWRYLVEPYDVNRFLIYEGDTESGRGMPGAFARFSRLFVERLKKERPNAIVVFLTTKPSPRRFDLWDSTYREANESLRKLAGDYPNVHLIDVATPLFDKRGKLREELFKSDGVHLNPEGYVIWTKTILPELEKYFGKP
jgi:hypothetical protein